MSEEFLMNNSTFLPAHRGVTWAAAAVLGLSAAVLLPGCSGGGGGQSYADELGMEGAIPIAYVKRVNTIGMNPTNGAPSAPGGDLMVRELSSPSAKEHNLTEKITQGQGDASDPEVSYNGKKII